MKLSVSSQKDIHLAHIFIPGYNKMIVQPDSKSAESRINKAYEALKQHSFEQVALEYSEDPSVKINKGDIGYITVFVLPYTLLKTLCIVCQLGNIQSPLRSASRFSYFQKSG